MKLGDSGLDTDDMDPYNSLTSPDQWGTVGRLAELIYTRVSSYRKVPAGTDYRGQPQFKAKHVVDADIYFHAGVGVLAVVGKSGEYAIVSEKAIMVATPSELVDEVLKKLEPSIPW